jgi:Ca2+-binding EF-hand superfamily protein
MSYNRTGYYDNPPPDYYRENRRSTDAAYSRQDRPPSRDSRANEISTYSRDPYSSQAQYDPYSQSDYPPKSQQYPPPRDTRQPQSYYPRQDDREQGYRKPYAQSPKGFDPYNSDEFPPKSTTSQGSRTQEKWGEQKGFGVGEESPEFGTKRQERIPAREESTKLQDSSGFQRTDERGYARPDDRGYARPDDRGYARPDDRGYARPDDRGYGRPDDRGYARPDDRGYARPDDRGYLRPDDRGYARPDDRGYARPDDRGYLRPDDRGYARPDDRGYDRGRGPYRPEDYNYRSSSGDRFQPPAPSKPVQNTPKPNPPLNALQIEDANKLLSSALISKIFEDLNKSLPRITVDMGSLMSQADDQKLGYISPNAFRNILIEKVGLLNLMICSKEELEDICKIFDFHKNNTIEYKEFLRKIRNPEYSIGGKPLPRRISAEWQVQVYRSLSKIIEDNKLNIEFLFTSRDKDARNLVDFDTFKSIMLEMKKNLTYEEVCLLADDCNPKAENGVNYRIFMNKIEAALQGRRNYNKILADLTKHLLDNGIDFSAKFSEVDPRNTGRIIGEDFRDFLYRKLGFNSQPYELNAFIEELPKEGSNLDLRELIKTLPKPRPKLNISQILTKIKTWILAQNKTLREVMMMFDKNSDGGLSPFEMSQALAAMNISTLSNDDIAAFIQLLDKDKNSKISLEELSDKLGIPVDPPPTGVIETVFTKIRSFLRNNGLQLIDYFRRFDKDFSSSISEDEFTNILLDMRLDMQPGDIHNLFLEIDKNRNGSLSFMEFDTKYEDVIDKFDRRDFENKEKLKTALKGKRPGDVFRITLDSNTGSQVIQSRELEHALEFLGLKFSSEDVERLKNQFDREGRGFIPIKNLEPFFEPEMLNPAPRPKIQEDLSGTSHWAEKYFKQIRDYASRNKKSIKETVEQFVVDSPGLLNLEEFSNAMNVLTIDITPTDIDKLAAELRKEGKIFIKDLAAIIEGKDPDKLEKILLDIKNFLISSKKRIEEVFRVDSMGWIFRPDIVTAFKSMSISFDINDLVAFINLLNPDIQKYNITNPTQQKISRASLHSVLKLPDIQETPTFTAKQLEQKIKRGIYDTMSAYASRMNLNLERHVFKKLDPAGTNIVSRNSFLEVLLELSENRVSSEQLESIIEDYDAQKSGKVNYQPFITAIQDGIVFKAFADRMFVKIKKECMMKSITPIHLFEDADIARVSHLTFDTMIDVMRKGGIDIVREDFSRLAQGLETDAAGKIAYIDFCNRISNANLESFEMLQRETTKPSPFGEVERPYTATYSMQEDAQKSTLDSFKRKSPRNLRLSEESTPTFTHKSPDSQHLHRESETDLLTHWAEQYFITIREYMNNNLITLKQTFADFDVDRSNSLSVSEFSRALVRMGVSISDGEMQRLMQDLDTNRDGRISLTEFSKILGTAPTNQWAENRLSDLRKLIQKSGLNLRNFFLDSDRDKSKYLTYQTFIQAVTRLDPSFTFQDLQKLALYLDIDQNGKIYYPEFMAKLEEDLIQELNSRFRKMIEDRKINLREEFEKVDTRKEGYLTEEDIIQAIYNLQLSMNNSDLQAIVLENFLHRARDGRFSYNELLEKLQIKEPQVDSYTKIKLHFVNRKLDAGKIFSMYDSSQDGTFTFQQLYETITYSGVQITRDEIEKIFRELPKAGEGKVYYDTLLEKIQGKPQGNYTQAVYAKLKKTVELKRIDLEAMFRSMDIYKTETVSRSMLVNYLAKLGISLNESEVEILVEDLDPARSNSINYMSFIKKVAPNIIPVARAPSPVPSRPTQRPIDKISSAFKAKGMSVKEVFMKFDVNRDNRVSREEFKSALAQLSLDITEAEIESVIRELDSSGDNTISLSEFEALLPDLAMSEQSVRNSMNSIRNTISTKRIDIDTVLALYDPGSSGSISIQDFIEGIGRISPQLQLKDLQELAKYYTRSPGRVDTSAFKKDLTGSSIESINAKVKEYIMKQGYSISQTLAPLDPGDQCVPIREFRRALESLRLPLTPEEMTQLIHENSLYKTPDNRVSFKDLIDRLGLREKIVSPKPTLEKVLKYLKEELQTRPGKPIDIFTPYDYEGDLHLTRQNFSQALVYAKIPLSNEELDILLPSLKKLPDGRVSAESFIRLVFGEQQSNEQLYRKLKSMVEQKRVNIDEILERYDGDRDRKLTYAEVNSAFRTMGLGISEEEFGIIFNELDKAKEGKIVYSELVSRIGASKAQVDMTDMKWAEPILTTIKKSLIDYNTTCSQFFSTYKIDADGFLDVRDFRDGLNRLGISPASLEAQRLVNHFLITPTGKIKYPEFEWALDTYAKVAASKPLPRYRLLTRTEVEYSYRCLDYISECIRNDKKKIEDVVKSYDVNNNGYIDIIELDNLITKELNIPSDETVFQDLYLLLQDESDKIPVSKLIDALYGTRVSQIQVGAGQSRRNEKPPLAPNKPQASDRGRDIALLLRDTMAQYKMNVANIFGKSTGNISRDTFLLSLRNARFNLSQSEQEELVKFIASDSRLTTVSLETFNQFLQSDKPAASFSSNPASIPQSTITTSTPINPQTALEALNKEFLRYNISPEDVFNRYDLDGDGVMTKNEFLQACSDYKISIQPSVLNQIFDLIDFNRSGAVSINEFALRLPSSRPDQEVRKRNLDITQQLEEEIEKLFKLFDLNGDGWMSEDEISQAFKAYGIVLPPQEVQSIIRKMDINRDGKIQYSEFRSVMEDTIKKDILNNEDHMQDLRQKFIEADIMKLGYLTPSQVSGVLTQMQINLNPTEFNSLIDMADTNHDGKIDIDEFMMLITGFDPEIQYDEKASSVLFNIRKGRKLSPLDFVKIYKGLPRHFIPSFIFESHKMGRNLPSFGISPTLDNTGLQFKDLTYTTKANRLNIPTYLKQNDVAAGGYISFQLATGISIPDPTLIPRESILKRVLRVSMFDEKRQELVGNSCYLEGTWKQELEDRWVFKNPADSDSYKIAYKASSENDLKTLSIIFEFVVVILGDNMVSELSCGYAKTNLESTLNVTSMKVPVSGGTPLNPLSIDNSDIRTYRKGLRHFLKMTGISRVTSELQINLVPFRRLSVPEQGYLDSLPSICVIQKKGLQMCKIYRDYIARIFAETVGQNFLVPKISDTFITQFPKILDCPDLWGPLIQFWNSTELQSTVGANRTDEDYLISFKNLVNRLYTVMRSQEFELDEILPSKFTFGIRNSRGELYSKRMEIVWKALRNTPDAKLDMLSYKPFDLTELSTKSMLNIDKIMNLKLKTMHKPGMTSTSFDRTSAMAVPKLSSSASQFYSSRIHTVISSSPLAKSFIGLDFRTPQSGQGKTISINSSFQDENSTPIRNFSGLGASRAQESPSDINTSKASAPKPINESGDAVTFRGDGRETPTK